MKKITIAVALLCAAACNTAATAADNRTLLPIADAMAANNAQNRLGDIKFFFGNQATPRVLKKLGSDRTSQKTNAFGKSAETACNWAFLSGMLQLEKKARAVGANAVINIVSNYNNVEFASDSQFECHVGHVMAGAAFKGDFVKIPE